MQKFDIETRSMPIKVTLCHLCGSDRVGLAVLTKTKEGAIDKAALVCADCENVEKIDYQEWQAASMPDKVKK